MDQHALFRQAVRTVLTILLDETRDPADRVKHATDILLGLPVPMQPETTHTVSSTEPDLPLYLAGADGLPTPTEYIPEDQEGPLTAEEVALMLHEQHKG